MTPIRRRACMDAKPRAWLATNKSPHGLADRYERNRKYGPPGCDGYALHFTVRQGRRPKYSSLAAPRKTRKLSGE